MPPFSTPWKRQGTNGLSEFLLAKSKIQNQKCYGLGMRILVLLHFPGAKAGSKTWYLSGHLRMVKMYLNQLHYIWDRKVSAQETHYFHAYKTHYLQSIFENFFSGSLDFETSYVFKRVIKVSTIYTLTFTETFKYFVENFIETIVFVPNIFWQDVYFNKFLKDILKARGQCFLIFRTFKHLLIKNASQKFVLFSYYEIVKVASVSLASTPFTLTSSGNLQITHLLPS